MTIYDMYGVSNTVRYAHVNLERPKESSLTESTSFDVQECFTHWYHGRDERIDGEYDPPYVINQNPTKEQQEAAQRILEKYERMTAEITETTP